MPLRSAGVLLYRVADPAPEAAREVLLVHPGGPFWAKKDAGTWSVPKGLVQPDEDVEAAARREFTEETGMTPVGTLTALGDFRQPGGKVVTAFALAGDFDLAGFRSNTFMMEWPPKSGRMTELPEADRAGWFSLSEAEEKLVPGQRPILAALARLLGGG